MESSRLLARYWNGKPYLCSPSRKFQLSPGTLRRLYYAWLKSGRNDSALALQFRAPITAFQLSPRHWRHIGKLLRAPATVSLVPVHRALFPHAMHGASLKHWYRKLPPQLKRQCRKIFRARRAARHAERKFATALKELA
jgi:hypothetical protein